MRTLYLQMIAALVLLALPGMVSAEAAPTAGKLLVDIRLEAPATPEERAYLGFTDSGSFNPTTIAGRLLVIEIFSMYCPHCQREGTGRQPPERPFKPGLIVAPVGWPALS